MQSYQFVTNINDLYKPALNAGQIPFYSDFLKKYTDNQLNQLWSFVMNGHCRTSPPTIGELGKFATNVTATKNISPEQQKKIDIQNLTEEEIFSTPIGRQSLTESWADSYLKECERHGIPDQTEAVSSRFQRGAHEASKAAYSLEGEKDIFSKTSLGFYQTMRERNKEHKENYAHLINNRLHAGAV